MVLQYGNPNLYGNEDDLCKTMHVMAKDVEGGVNTDDDVSISIMFNQQTFKRNLSHLFTDKLITTISTTKKARVTQSKRFPRPSVYDAVGRTTLSVTHLIGWK